MLLILACITFLLLFNDSHCLVALLFKRFFIRAVGIRNSLLSRLNKSKDNLRAELGEFFFRFSTPNTFISFKRNFQKGGRELHSSLKFSVMTV